MQRDHLVEANRQLDDRRHFMETVLAGVSSGVIGLDGNGKIKVVNNAAADLSSTKAEDAIGRRLDEMVPDGHWFVGKERIIKNRMGIRRHK